jgi:hypothetical protein
MHLQFDPLREDEAGALVAMVVLTMPTTSTRTPRTLKLPLCKLRKASRWASVDGGVRLTGSLATSLLDLRILVDA